MSYFSIAGGVILVLFAVIGFFAVCIYTTFWLLRREKRIHDRDNKEKEDDNT